MFDNIKNSVIDHVFYEPMMEECVGGSRDNDNIRDYFLDECADCGCDCELPSIPDSLFDDEEFNDKTNELIDFIPEDDFEDDDFEDPDDEFGHW